jgi:ABC-2 type transport system permease protein
MDKFAFSQFLALLKKEVLEHRNLFIGAPAVFAFVLFVASVWILSLITDEELTMAIQYLATLFNGLSPLQMAPMFVFLAIPFVLLLAVCALMYLGNALFADRKDMSIFFWQSMPVSNARTVCSKVVAVVVVAPMFYLAVLLATYIFGIVWITLLGLAHGVEVAGLGYMFLAAVTSLLLVYLSIFSAGLWLLPTIGWFLLFSAFARRTPFLWAISVFFLLGLLEDLVFGSQYLANWVESRANPNQYIIFEFSDVLDRLFNYDMLFGILVGAILLTGATYMRRFID